MKYKLAFVNDCKNSRHTFLYKDEVKFLMFGHDMIDLYHEKIAPVDNNRWTPGEIFAALEKE